MISINKLKTQTKKNLLYCDEWLDDSNLDFVIEYFQKKYPNFKILTHAQLVCSLIEKHFDLDLKNKNLIILCGFNSHWCILTNVTSIGMQNYNSVDNVFYVYDSLNIPNYVECVVDIFKVMFQDRRDIYVFKPKVFFPQNNLNDCGLFALAYIKSLCEYQEPALIEFDQSNNIMRRNYNKFIFKNDDYVVATKKILNKEIIMQLYLVNIN
jgi:hypothetical protein